MQGASPLASPGLKPGDTGTGAAYRALAGGLAPALPDDLAISVPSGGGGWGCRPALPLALILPPIPPAPFPGGEGGIQGYFMQGASPLASPRLDGARHWLFLPYRYPEG